MSERSRRRRLNRALARQGRREQMRAERDESEKKPASSARVGLRRAFVQLVTAFVLIAAAGLVLSFLQWRQIQALGEQLGTSLDSIAQALSDRNNEIKKSEETIERAVAAANRQAAAFESANKTASDALIVGRRAWVGVVDARIEGRVTPNADLNIIVDYRNTGREPATHLAAIQTPMVIEAEKRADPTTMSRLEQFAERCLAEGYVGAGIAFPSGEAQAYQTEAVVKASEIDDALIDGRKLVIVQGCIVYMTGGAIHHSASCYLYQGGKTPPDHFSPCARGAAAD